MSFWNTYLNELYELKKFGATIFCVGHSVLKRPIYCIKIGKGKKKILLQYAIHAREYITYHLAIMQTKNLLKTNIDGEVFLIPVSNPDGVCLCVDGLKSIENSIDATNNSSFAHFASSKKPHSVFYLKKLKKNLLEINQSDDFSLWKANINCVDLNVNFDAKWGQGKFNKQTKSSENYIGPKPFSEPESRALASFAKALRPDMTISYHSKGEVIFWNFCESKKQIKRDKIYAKMLEEETGYKLRKTQKSCGGFKDWCTKELDIPSFTIEVGAENLVHPIEKKHLLHIYCQNKNVITKSLALLNNFKL